MDVGPGAAQFAVDEPAIEGPTCAGSSVEIQSNLASAFTDPKANPGAKKHRSGVFYGCRRHLPVNTEHPLAALVIEAGLTAAEKPTAIGPRVQPAPIWPPT